MSVFSCKPNIYVSWSTSEHRVRLSHRETGLSPPVKYFNDRSRAVLLLWIICVIYVLFFLLCFRARLFIDALWSPARKGLTSWLSLSHWYPGAGVVLDCFDPWSLPSFLLLKHGWFVYMYAVIYCLYQNPTIIFEPVSSKRYKLTCVPITLITLRWAVHRQEMALKTKTLIRLFWCADWFDYLWYEHNSLYLMLDTSLFQTTRVIFYVRRIGLYLYKYSICDTITIYILKGLALVYHLIKFLHH